MRTIAEIKESIAADFMRNEAAAARFGFKAGDRFSEHFSQASVVGLLFYVFACAAWVLEKLFDTYRKEVDARIDAMLPHRAKWYRDKMLAFLKDRPLEPDTDRCDTTGMTAEQVAAAQVVRHAVAAEDPEASLLTIKVAGESNGQRCPLDAATEKQLAAYIAQIKDAGVRTKLVNADADVFDCLLDIYYDPMLQENSVKGACHTAIRDYIENLPFNGEYTNMGLVDRLQQVEGVRIVEFHSATATAATTNVPISQTIDARHVPAAGYFKTGEITLNMNLYNG